MQRQSLYVCDLCNSVHDLKGMWPPCGVHMEALKHPSGGPTSSNDAAKTIRQSVFTLEV